jgi:hypothetical protein
MTNSIYKLYITYTSPAQEGTQDVQKLLTYSIIHTGGPKYPEMLLCMYEPANCTSVLNPPNYPPKASSNPYRSYSIPGLIYQLYTPPDMYTI